jgi:hypothetical protein
MDFYEYLSGSESINLLAAPYACINNSGSLKLVKLPCHLLPSA